MSPTAAPVAPPLVPFTYAARDYALARMEIGPHAHTVHYATQALQLGATEDEVNAAMHRYLGTPWLVRRADEAILGVEIDAADASIRVERLADQVCAGIREQVAA